MKVGDALKDLRKVKGLRQNKAASGIGITQTYMSQIESNDKKPSLEVLEKVASYYQIPISIILWKGVEVSDVPEHKQEVFNYVKPLVDQLIEQII